MNDLQYTIGLICQRRQVTLNKVESVAFTMRCAFGLANLTALLPVAADTFYYIDRLHCYTVSAQATAGAALRFSDLGGGSGGNVDVVTPMAVASYLPFAGIETTSLLYLVNGNTAGLLSLHATVYKVTYS